MVDFSQGNLRGLVQHGVKEQGYDVSVIEEGRDSGNGVHGPVKTERDGGKKQLEVKGGEIEKGEESGDDRGGLGDGVVCSGELQVAPESHLQPQKKNQHCSRCNDDQGS